MQNTTSVLLNKRKAIGRVTSHPQKRAGFTLIEVMVVVGILAILAALAVPSFRDIIERYRVKSTTESLISSIYLARTEAMKRGGGVEFSKISGMSDCPESNTNGQWGCGWRIRAPDPSNAGAFITIQTIEKQRDVTVVLDASNINTMTYNGQGRASNLGLGTFRFTVRTKGSSGAITSLCMGQAGRLREVKNATCS